MDFTTQLAAVIAKQRGRNETKQMDSQEQTTIPNEQATLTAILDAIRDLGNRITNLENETRQSIEELKTETRQSIEELKTETRQRLEEIETRLTSVEIKLDNVEGHVAEAVSVAYKAVSIAKFMSAEMRALRAEYAQHGREIDELKAA